MPSLVTTGLVWSCCKTHFADLGFQPDPCTEAPSINPTKYIFTIFEWADMVILCQISKETEKEKKNIFPTAFLFAKHPGKKTKTDLKTLLI